MESDSVLYDHLLNKETEYPRFLLSVVENSTACISYWALNVLFVLLLTSRV